MKILIADKFQKVYLPQLMALGHEVVLKPDIKADELPKQIKSFEVLIVRSKKVSANTINASDKLKMIIRAGAGYNTIDIDTAAKKGIYVCNTPGKNSIAVAELAFGLMLAIDRKIADNVIDLRQGKWNKKKYSEAEGIYGKTLGIIGMGEIGMAFAERAKVFGMKILAYDPVAIKNPNPKQIELQKKKIFEFKENLEDIVKESDVITLHVPSNAHTKGMVNKEFLKNVKNNAIILNTSRGDIIVEHDLIDAMIEKNIWVGVDVYSNEPEAGMADFSSFLSTHSHVYGTHHVGASTEQAQDAIAVEVIEMIKAFAKGKVMHPVNKHLMT
jgi:D-3-phosphoglycerate dehydrogenase